MQYSVVPCSWRRLFQIALLVLTPHAWADPSLFPGPYWNRPVPLQTPAPAAPDTCAVCHTGQYTDWSGSRHAQAFSPGLLGQLVDFAEADAVACLACHAPLAEQQSVLLQTDLERLAADPDGYRPELLARHGVFCAACHLRDGILHAPEVTASGTKKRVHARVRREPLMRDSRFCAACHQFDKDASINGKPLQDTYREWLASPYPEQGRTCQSCHMPDRAHLFRGIHHADMVRRGVSITTQATEEGARLEVRSTGVGHRLPTYIVPRIQLIGVLLDSDGQPIGDAVHEKVLQRLMTFANGRWIEHGDTRLAPGASATLVVPWEAGGRRRGKAIRFRILVEPEWFYSEHVYPIVLEELEEGPARDLIKQAKSNAESQSFVLFETTMRAY